ncbi:Magnesium-chelatase 60 kDa subunit [Roseivivax jejudonensis]|uniref:Magnesium-chelatase 60 kDa subunit n=1 Tax=Roseivivax jejudonensis TaxID=1529041 RepID=A0A1X6ZN27_9RHOB|nr:magnesium chelatase subunit D [Roseivivax jejudonensis]SLN56534.1 Magnesium-chelatase 60 kDa subunit [Roseivivax jejudonensis]
MKDEPGEVWVAGQLAATLLTIDPARLGGMHLRARVGPARTAFLDALPPDLAAAPRIAPGIADETLYGGTDIAASLAAGRKITADGVLARGGALTLTSAERTGPGLAARLALALDAGAVGPLLILDEGTEDERAPERLIERAAFACDLDGLRPETMAEIALSSAERDAARARLCDVTLPDDALTTLVSTAAALGIDSLRAPLFATAAARAHAALSGRNSVTSDDLEIAVSLVFAHRATRLPSEEPDEETSDPPPDPETTDDGDSDPAEGDTIPQEMLIEAVRAMLPAGLLAQRRARKANAPSGAGQGARRRGAQRGRPLPARPGTPSATARIDVVATLRAAAPWQGLRRAADPDRPGLIIRKSDLRLRRFQDRSERLVIFCVDASGSAAMARLAEAKGAVELMLAEAYSRRDRVALVTFRGEGAEVSLPPTRSLVQAKRRLAGLPGGGGTPLAAGLRAVHALAERARRAGQSPALALLTDGRANVALPGGSGRAQAMADAEAMAGHLRACGLDGVVIDTGARPRPELETLAGRMDLGYLALPRADAAAMKRGVDAALGV